jgi:dihydroorotase
MDTLIKNGLVVSPQGRLRASVGIRDGKIAGLYEPGTEPQAHTIIDATGLTVLPGAIDMHSHHRQGSQKGFE